MLLLKLIPLTTTFTALDVALENEHAWGISRSSCKSRGSFQVVAPSWSWKFLKAIGVNLELLIQWNLMLIKIAFAAKAKALSIWFMLYSLFENSPDKFQLNRNLLLVLPLLPLLFVRYDPPPQKPMAPCKF